MSGTTRDGQGAQGGENDALARALDPYAFTDHWNDNPYVARRHVARADAARFLNAARAAGWRVLPPVPCGSCGAPSITRITLRGQQISVCLRHYNHWRTPTQCYTCPTDCVEANHPGMEHEEWLDQIDLWYPDDEDDAPPVVPAPADPNEEGR